METPSLARTKRAWLYLAATAIGLSLSAMAMVLGNVVAGAQRTADENAWAHLFQLAMGAQLPLLLTFLWVADWTRMQRVMLLLGGQVLAAGAAFAVLLWSGY